MREERLFSFGGSSLYTSVEDVAVVDLDGNGVLGESFLVALGHRLRSPRDYPLLSYST